MPRVSDCPFFLVDLSDLPEPYQSSYSLGFEDSISDIYGHFFDNYADGNLLERIVSSRNKLVDLLHMLSEAGSSSCLVQTNLEEVKKSQYNSFVSYLRFKFEKMKTLCNYAINWRYNQDCKKIALRYTFDFLNNTFDFDCNISDDVLQDSVKVEESFNMGSFSGTIYYIFYVKPVGAELNIDAASLNRVLGEALNFNSSSPVVPGQDSQYDFSKVFPYDHTVELKDEEGNVIDTQEVHSSVNQDLKEVLKKTQRFS